MVTSADNVPFKGRDVQDTSAAQLVASFQNTCLLQHSSDGIRSICCCNLIRTTSKGVTNNDVSTEPEQADSIRCNKVMFCSVYVDWRSGSSIAAASSDESDIFWRCCGDVVMALTGD
jgi:hypothetical protein